MQEMMRYSTTVDYCQYKSLTEDGEWVTYAYRKPTLLCTNVPGAAEINRRCNCEGKRHASSLIGDKARGKRGTRTARGRNCLSPRSTQCRQSYRSKF